MDKLSSPSLIEATYLSLRSDLIAGDFKPNDKLKIGDLSKHVGASQSVVREVLSRLVSEGLVVAEPQRGFRIAPLEVSELHHLTRARSEIENLCLSDAIRNGDVPWESGIVSALHSVNRMTDLHSKDRGKVSEEWLMAHATFHRALVSACQNPWYLKIRETLYMHSERYRALALRFTGGTRDLNREHSDIAQAVIARDTKRACKLMTAHIELTTESLVGKVRRA